MQRTILGIHHRPGSFSDRWIEYCRQNNVPYQRVDAFASDLIAHAHRFDALLWHWSHYEYSAQMVARQIIRSLEAMGLIVFPNTNTCWHYDDKVGQKYFLEAIGAPLAPTWVFYRVEDALDWLAHAAFPIVFKLSKGAGSCNVRLVKSWKEAARLTKIAFTHGFSCVPAYYCDLKTKAHRMGSLRDLWSKALRGPTALRMIATQRRRFPHERQYVYFQEYMANNAYDTRVTIIGHRAFAFLRRNRPGDFRASGSGNIDHRPESVDLAMVKEAFGIVRAVGSQSLAMDFVYDARRHPVVLEISYCFSIGAVRDCPGYWDESLAWHSGHVYPEDAIIEDVLAQLAASAGKDELHGCATRRGT